MGHHHVSKTCRILLAGLSTAGLAVSVAAQNAPPQSPPGQSPAPEQKQAGGLEEIVVTAQRHSEDLQKVPISITAVTASALAKQGVATTDKLGTVVPGLTMTRQTRGPLPFIRGVGAQSTIIGNENTVATYIDGVYMVDILGSAFSFNNIERVEVLKGPQGTLFGRNATGGLINVITRDPSSRASVSGSLNYGNYGTVEGSLYATGGSDTLKADIAAYGIHQNDGFGKYLLTGKDANFRREAAVRSKIMWTPTAEDKFTLALDWGTNHSDLGQSRTVLPGAKLVGGTTFTGTIWDSTGGPTHINSVVNDGVSLRYERNLGFATMTVLNAYRHNLQKVEYDQDSSPLQLADVTQNQVNESLQNEVYLNGNSGRINWTAGAFIFTNTARYLRLGIRSVAPASNTDLTDKQETHSYAGYGQATYKATDRLSLTAGIRYTIDKRDLSGRRVAAPGNTLPAGTVLQTITPDQAHVRYGKATWRLAADYRITPDILAYVSYNRGFKSGVFNLSNITAPAVKPETLDAYEVGLKSELFDRQLRLNLAGFHYDYKGIQLTTVQAGIASFFNAATGRVNGLEASAELAPRLSVGDLSFTAGFSYLHARYTSFPDGPLNTPLAAGGNVQTLADLSGNHMIRAPDWTASLGFSYSVPVGEREAGISGNFFHSDGFFWEPDNRLRQRPYNVVNGQAYLAFGATNQFRFRVFAENIFNEKYWIYQAANSFGDTGAAANPRTYGVGVDFKF